MGKSMDYLSTLPPWQLMTLGAVIGAGVVMLIRWLQRKK